MNWLRRFLGALRFLTVIPIPGKLGTTPEDLAGAPPFFPITGMIIGILAGGCSWLFFLILPPLAAAVCSVAALASFSGALHLDGLADSADGFFSSRPKEQLMEIMRDSRIGVMGVVALFLVLFIKISCLATLEPRLVAKTVFLMPLMGRVCLVVMMAVLPYARPEGGLGSLFYTREMKKIGFCWVLFAVVFMYLLAGVQGLLATGLVAMVILLFALFCKNKIGGATGDTLGAACELGETCVALGFCLKFFV